MAYRLYNALSATFPKGEAFFVESVRAFREGTPPKLEAEIRAFVTQEVMHSREHVQFNKRAVEAGYDIAALEARVEWRLSITKDRPPIVNLAATMCLEHSPHPPPTMRGTRSIATRRSPKARLCGAGTRLRISS